VAAALIRRRSVLAGLAVLALVVALSLAAPLYAHWIAHTDAFAPNPNGTIVVHGQRVSVLQPGATGLGETPIGPTWTSRYLLGADGQGRDAFARVLYGGRISLTIGFLAAGITCLIALALGLAMGFFRGWFDAILARVLDLVWAFPVYLLAIALASATLAHGIPLGPLTIDSSSILLPTLIIALVSIPYVARPVRAEAMAVRSSEFVEAATASGASTWRLIVGELLPNVLDVVLVLAPFIVASNIIYESTLSYLSIGVQPPQASWGSLVSDGQDLLYTRPLVSILPGVMIVLTLMALYLVGDGVRDALKPGQREELPR
jgi:peptide/nickel transport system permease protein